MKAKVYPRPSGLSGRMGDIVYCYNSRTGMVVARQYTRPEATAQNGRIGAVNRNLHALEPSEAYQRDLRDYIHRYNSSPEGQLKPLHSWSGLFIKLMYALAGEYPGIDLSTLTRGEIYSQDLPCVSVRRAVEAGLLPQVYDYGSLEHEL